MGTPLGPKYIPYTYMDPVGGGPCTGKVYRPGQGSSPCNSARTERSANRTQRASERTRVQGSGFRDEGSGFRV